MRLDLEADLAVDPADQRIKNVDGDVDHSLAVGALQMGMRRRRYLVGRRRHGEVVDGGGTADVGVGDQPQLAERRQGAIDGRPVDPRSKRLGPGDDLVGGQVLISAVENLDDGLASSGHALVLVAEQTQCGLDSRRGRRSARSHLAGLHAHDSPPAASVGIGTKCDTIASGARCDNVASGKCTAIWVVGGRLLSAPGIAAVRRMPAGLRGRLSRQEWRSIVGMASSILLLHIVGWGVLVGIVAPQHYQVSSTQVLGIGLGLTAYTLGMRHAFDADHIAAIDNTTRKLMAEGKRPVSVGFWFSLGHSTIVFGLVALLALGVRAGWAGCG